MRCAGVDSARPSSARQRCAALLGWREHQGAQAQEEPRAHAHEQHQVADAGTTGADAASQRVQHDAAQLAATVSCPGTDTGAIARGQAATRAAMVLSDLLG
ncbi:DUF2514 family protein [Pseudomonas fulva]|uniref:DUF2514 family protein n=1 Tax=Pseudomonas fulva TaxID=47880 RepID=UPI0039B04937